MRSHFTPGPVGKSTMRSHFISGAAIACAVTGATALMPGTAAGQIAYDAASDPAYAGGWSAGQNAGYGFGAWSFNNTDANPAGQYQGISGAGSIGTAWTLLSHSTSSGLANAGRSITAGGGLQVGQTFETVIQNPTTTAGYYTYRGWDLLFTGGTDNDAPGDNTSALRAQVFDYYNGSLGWAITDGSGTTHPSLTGPITGAMGARIDLTLNSASAYSLTVTPLNGSPVYSQSGTYAGPIDYVNFRLYNTDSAGLGDVANNYGISYMEIVPEPATFALVGMGLGGLLFFRRRK
jgi:PEP-CTERM motif